MGILMSDDGGLSRFQARMRAIPKAAREAVEPALELSANELVGRMKHLAPRDEGDLQASIAQTEGEHELERLVKAGGALTTRPVRSGQSVTYDYAKAIEHGTTTRHAQPFFWNSFRLSRKRITNRIRRAIAKAVKQEWSK
jgi:HK97 gp10 family phage protein